LDGRPLVALVRLDIPLRDGKPDFSQVVVTGSDITERKQAEAKLQELLEQTRRDAHTKAELLKEVNHRVKNNLLAILGLALAEQRHATTEEKPVAQRITANLRRRLEGLLEVHQMLSASQWAPMPVDQLARRIIQSALAAVPTSCSVTVDLQPSAVQVSPRQASNLALVLNELATNTIKYALAGRAVACITLAITGTATTIRLDYRDDGPGYPAAVLRQEGLSTGLELVRDITTQTLRGRLTFANDGGAVTVMEILVEEVSRT
jgi:two-component sensor histidine kinase